MPRARARSSSTRNTTPRSSRRKASAIRRATSPCACAPARRAGRARHGDALAGNLPQRDHRPLRAARSAASASMPRAAVDRCMRSTARRALAQRPRAGDCSRRSRASCARGEQSLVFINRRGYAPVLTCELRLALGLRPLLRAARAALPRTSACAATTAATRRRVPAACPNCGNPDLRAGGAGHAARRGDARAALSRGARAAHRPRQHAPARRAGATCGSGSARREVDILVGTQILAKGHDFPHLTLVGVLMPTACSTARTSARPSACLRCSRRSPGAPGAANRRRSADPDRVSRHPLYAALQRPRLPAVRGPAARRAPAGAVSAVRASGAAAGRSAELERRARVPRQRRAARGAGSACVSAVRPGAGVLTRRAGRERAQLLVQSDRARAAGFLKAWRAAVAAAQELDARALGARRRSAGVLTSHMICRGFMDCSDTMFDASAATLTARECAVRSRIR